MPPLRVHFLAVAIALGLPLHTVGQAPSPAAAASPVAQMRQEFEANVLKATVSLNEYYDRRLAALETDLAAEGDYAQARLVKQRRDEIAALAKTAAGGAGSLTVPLPADAAKLVGVQVKNGELQGWRTATSSAEWTLPKLLQGAYRLELSYSMDEISSPLSNSTRQPAEEAEFGFREILLAGTSKNVLPVKLVANKGVLTAVQVPGVIQVAKAPVTLRLSCSAFYPLNSIVFRDLRLVPVAANLEAAPVAAPVVTLGGEFQRLQKQQVTRLIELRKPLLSAYQAELAKLAVNAKGDDAEAVEAEQRRVTKLAASTSFGKTNGMGMEGYDDISDVHFVPDPANTGDQFKVEHNGEQFKVRLLWVACPPVAAQDSRTLKLAMSHFGADEAVALMIGGSAREFTELYLQSRPLRLLVRTKAKRAKEESLEALVFLEDIGLFQNVLIENGFAIVDPPANPGKGLVESSLLKSLQDRESMARRHEPAQGGWALGTKGGKTAR